MTDSFKKQLLLQLFIASGVIILSAAATQFATSLLAQTANKIRDQRSELALRTVAASQLASLKNDFEKTKPLFNILNAVLPSKDQLADFSKYLNDLAKQNKLDLGFRSSGETAPTVDAPGFIKFSLNGAGTYSNFVKFLKAIEKNKLFIKFNSADLSRQPRSDNFKITASGQVFYQ